MSDRCSACGAPLSWDPGQTRLACPFCGTVNARSEAAETARPRSPWGLPTEPAIEDRIATPWAAALAVERAPSGDVAIACAGCGAEVRVEPGQAALPCPFCATPLARGEAHPAPGLPPDAVLPILLDERAARDALRRWLRGLWFAPSGLAGAAEATRPPLASYRAVYAFDADAEAAYRGQRGRRVRTMGGRSKPRYRTRWQSVRGHVSARLSRVLVAAGESRAAEGGAWIESNQWDLGAIRPFSPDYLAGFRAEAPAITLAAARHDFEGKARAVMTDRARADIGGDKQRVQSLDLRLSDVAVAHVLVPVWTLTYRYRNRGWAVVVNGRTGRVHGRRPYSALKIALAVVAGLLVLGAVLWLYAQQN